MLLHPTLSVKPPSPWKRATIKCLVKPSTQFLLTKTVSAYQRVPDPNDTAKTPHIFELSEQTDARDAHDPHAPSDATDSRKPPDARDAPDLSANHNGKGMLSLPYSARCTTSEPGAICPRHLNNSYCLSPTSVWRSHTYTLVTFTTLASTLDGSRSKSPGRGSVRGLRVGVLHGSDLATAAIATSTRANQCDQRQSQCGRIDRHSESKEHSDQPSVSVLGSNSSYPTDHLPATAPQESNT